MKTIQVKSYERKAPEKKPDPFQAQIDSLIAKKRNDLAAALKPTNAFRDSIGYEPGSRPLEIVMACARKLKVLALTGRV